MADDLRLERIRGLMRDVPDFPKPGILFKDITPVLGSAAALADCAALMAEPFADSDITAVAGIESRGFILGTPVALALGCGFVPIRKPGKLPADTDRVEYKLEYGSDAVEMHVDAVGPKDRVLVVDDVIATGGTACASIELLRRRGASVVGVAFLLEIAVLEGRARIDAPAVHSVLTY